jgi:hypothetical protein
MSIHIYIPFSSETTTVPLNNKPLYSNNVIRTYMHTILFITFLQLDVSLYNATAHDIGWLAEASKQRQSQKQGVKTTDKT